VRVINNGSVSTVVATIEDGKIVLTLDGEKLVEGKVIGIQFAYGTMGEPPSSGDEPNTAWGCGDITIAPIE